MGIGGIDSEEISRHWLEVGFIIIRRSSAFRSYVRVKAKYLDEERQKRAVSTTPDLTRSMRVGRVESAEARLPMLE